MGKKRIYLGPTEEYLDLLEKEIRGCLNEGKGVALGMEAAMIVLHALRLSREGWKKEREGAAA